MVVRQLGAVVGRFVLGWRPCRSSRHPTLRRRVARVLDDPRSPRALGRWNGDGAPTSRTGAAHGRPDCAAAPCSPRRARAVPRSPCRAVPAQQVAPAGGATWLRPSQNADGAQNADGGQPSGRCADGRGESRAPLPPCSTSSAGAAIGQQSSAGTGRDEPRRRRRVVVSWSRHVLGDCVLGVVLVVLGGERIARACCPRDRCRDWWAGRRRNGRCLDGVAPTPSGALPAIGAVRRMRRAAGRPGCRTALIAVEAATQAVHGRSPPVIGARRCRAWMPVGVWGSGVAHVGEGYQTSQSVDGGWRRTARSRRAGVRARRRTRTGPGSRCGDTGPDRRACAVGGAPRELPDQ